jgi:hypothetical protein
MRVLTAAEGDPVIAGCRIVPEDFSEAPGRGVGGAGGVWSRPMIADLIER